MLQAIGALFVVLVIIFFVTWWVDEDVDVKGGLKKENREKYIEKWRDKVRDWFSLEDDEDEEDEEDEEEEAEEEE